MGCPPWVAPGAHYLHLPLSAVRHAGGGSPLVSRPPPCSQSAVSWCKVAGLGAAVTECLGAVSGGDGGNADPRGKLGVDLSSHPGSSGAEAAFLHTLGVHHWVVWGSPGMAGGSVSSAGQPSPAGAAWGQRGLLKNGEGRGDPAGWE